MEKRQQMSPLKRYQSGIAGEYLVAAELSRRGYVASLTQRNTAGIDILASNASGSRTVAIQVKTTQGKRPVWTLGEKAESIHAPQLFYVLVLGLQSSLPEFYVVPSVVVARSIKRFHQTWLRTPGRGGKKHNDTSMRTFRDDKKKYLSAWARLKLHLP